MQANMYRRRFLLALSLALGGNFAHMANAQERPRIRVASLTLPVFAPIVVNIMKAKAFDAKNGFELQIQTYPSISAYYAGLATGEVDSLIGGPTYFQKLRLESVPIRIVATGAKLSDLVIVTKNPAIKSLADLRGKQLAADMGSGQFQVLSIYARSKGIDLGKDINLVNANFAVSRAQLAADRVDAAMVIEPIATMMLKDNPALKIIFDASAAWREITGLEGWELVYAMREDSLKRTPDMATKLIGALQDVAQFMRADPDGADKIAAESVKLPPGTLKDAVLSKRWDFDVHPAWQEQRRAIWDMFERAVAAGFHPKLPDEAIIYTP